MYIHSYKCCIFKGQLSAPQQQKTLVQTHRMSHSCQSQPAKQKRVERAMNISQESNYSSGFCLDRFYLSYAGYTCTQRCLLLLLTQNRLQWHPQVVSRVMVLWYHVCSSFNGCNKSIRLNWWHTHLITHPSNRQDFIGNLSQTYIGPINSKVKERFPIRSQAFLKPHCWVVLKNWKSETILWTNFWVRGKGRKISPSLSISFYSLFRIY